ncbi:LUD domain-containing protein [Pedobacter sp. UBA5917]|jgi:L-lactate dehydrogenase complex protein LldG|uniref:LUD domain-containing protein n=1 Tax=Pedobacter sp. UBA5917 TaxID=1947061 RepID=UPI002600EB59|nr:LUD domain-containing protein [Pedobacter sp. UBA5917]
MKVGLFIPYTSKDTSYGYNVFIMAPSKTADIEQSLVIGAHGAQSLSIFILAEPA